MGKAGASRSELRQPKLAQVESSLDRAPSINLSHASKGTGVADMEAERLANPMHAHEAEFVPPRGVRHSRTEQVKWFVLCVMWTRDVRVFLVLERPRPALGCAVFMEFGQGIPTPMPVGLLNRVPATQVFFWSAKGMNKLDAVNQALHSLKHHADSQIPLAFFRVKTLLSLCTCISLACMALHKQPVEFASPAEFHVTKGSLSYLSSPCFSKNVLQSGVGIGH